MLSRTVANWPGILNFVYQTHHHTVVYHFHRLVVSPIHRHGSQMNNSKKKLEGKIQQITITSLRGKCSGVTVKWNSSIVPYRSYYAKHYYLLHAQTSGMGALNPGIFRFGYDGGGPYLCMAINHGGGNFSEFCYKMHLKFFSIFTIIKGDILLKPIIHIHMYFFFHHKHTFLTKGPYTKLLFWVTLPIQG